MEPLQTNQAAVPVTGNPLDMGQSTSPAVAAAPLASTSVPIQAVPIQNASEPEASSATVVDPFRNVVTPPMPISSEVGTGSLTLDQTTTTETPPQKSSTLGLIIGIMLLISIIVGASLYYYFMIYSKPVAVVETPAPVTLIKKEPVVETPAPTPPVQLPNQNADPALLLSEIDGATGNLANIDTTIATFDEQAK